MQAARLYGMGDIRIETVPAPVAPGPDQVRIRVMAAGICGSDLHNFRTGQWITRAPVTPGHEFSGEVMAVGPGVTGFRTGDRVVADSRVGCGQCPSCRQGRRNLCATLGFVGEVCDGGFAGEVTLPARQLHRVPPDTPFWLAALAEPLSVAVHAVNRLAPDPGQPVVVCGGGAIGGLAALVLSERHDGAVYLVERDPQRQHLLQETCGVAPVALDALGTLVTGRSPRFMLDTTGSVAVAGHLLGCAAPGTRLVLAGLGATRLDLDLNVIVERELEVRGVSAFADEMPQAIALLPALRERLKAFVSIVQGVGRIPEVYGELLAQRRAGLKTLVLPHCVTEET
ncbi:zinc-dependent alcohol dehydrogenase [Komagataeibacter swingsii]|uniref:Alcohol dehydrogenase n=1 Tax=Komagataeibacter swingsii TaxID=215220 RepID=A0A2V4RTE0_9PROT|nr:alcohol dehydrogenase catalytic domain-containing protein [Komagataeibacter swingsii]PYD70917.1 alcohol dehydrogenase [Komagataeibacter swingsii]GBQ60812.1 alcohol dehydrogenase [Komagataeibacter swingsii DSM 16373]